MKNSKRILKIHFDVDLLVQSDLEDFLQLQVI